MPGRFLCFAVTRLVLFPLCVAHASAPVEAPSCSQFLSPASMPSLSLFAPPPLPDKRPSEILTVSSVGKKEGSKQRRPAEGIPLFVFPQQVRR
ncbi:hypothetical protein J3F83DRAFT_743133 [Trichoderma novae-zelandiae]